MTRLERCKIQLSDMVKEHNRLMRLGKYAQLIKINMDIEKKKREIEEAERYESRSITELMTSRQIHESGLIDALIECHFAADYLNDCACEVEDIAKKMGLEVKTMLPDLKAIVEQTRRFASILCNKGEILSEAMVNNETLIKALHKKTKSYIQQRINSFYPKNK